MEGPQIPAILVTDGKGTLLSLKGFVSCGEMKDKDGGGRLLV